MELFLMCDDFVQMVVRSIPCHLLSCDEVNF
jgi:hypothetical protein